ncbi:hypothetical protein ACFY2W_20995 [Streptomyces sp. NPDC001262]|uniref:NucA/NucB deoxyribonuclease domain-containing protein n=1 Tax=unclassified Streptomyces TaxID=2593676 RepID=UPI003688D415
MQFTPPKAAAPTSGTTTGTKQLEDPPCKPQEGSAYGYTRHTYCLVGGHGSYTLVDTKGNEKGTAEVSIDSTATLDAKSPVWKEHMTVKAFNFTGDVKRLAVALKAGCSGLCTMDQDSAWGGHKELNQGEEASGDVTFHSNVQKNKRDMITPEYHLDFYAVQEEYPTKRDTRWRSDVEVRCDAELSNTGCVVPKKYPELVLPIAQYGTAAVTYLFAQKTLAGSQGTVDKPLWRVRLSKKQAKERRGRTCPDSGPYSWSKIPAIPDDSCDEYPFARSFQGGKYAMQCAEIVPNIENGHWVAYPADPKRPWTGNETCVRGHVPLSQNCSAGQAYSTLIKNERVLHLDPFTVSIPDGMNALHVDPSTVSVPDGTNAPKHNGPLGDDDDYDDDYDPACS